MKVFLIGLQDDSFNSAGTPMNPNVQMITKFHLEGPTSDLCLEVVLSDVPFPSLLKSLPRQRFPNKLGNAHLVSRLV